MTELNELSITDFTAELGSDSPAPGGGTTAALAGAMACGLTAMVARITLNKIKLKDSADIEVDLSTLEEIISNSDSAREKFLSLMNDDTDAFNKILHSFRMPKSNDEEKERRKSAIQAATKHASEVPLETAKLAIRTLGWVKELINIGTTTAITDTGVAGVMAYSAVKGALWNVKINLGSIKDSGFIQETNFEIEKILSSLNKLWPEIQKSVETKIKD